MKKKLYFKLIFTFVLLMYLNISGVLFAVDLEFLANVTRGPSMNEIIANEETSKSKKTEQIAVLRTYSKRHGNSDSNKIWDWYTKTTTGGEDYYMSYGISFWGNRYSAEYDSKNINKWTKATYDTYGAFIKTETEDPEKELPNYNIKKNNDGSVKFYNLVNKNSNPDLTFNLSFKENSKFYRKRTMNIKQDNFTIAVHDTVITKAGIDELINKYYKNGDTTYVKNGYLKIRFSVLAHTTHPTYLSEFSSLKGKMPTAYYAVMAAKNMNTRNLGYDKDNNDAGVSGASILNYYDNWLYIPVAKLKARTVEVRYKVKDENGNWYIHDSQTSQIDSAAQDIAKKSIGELDKYYIGGKISKGTTKEDAQKNLDFTTKNWGWNNNKTNIQASNDEEYYIIEFYYDYRTIAENHLDANGGVIESSWNKVYKMFTTESLTLNAKKNEKNPTLNYFYNNGNKYVHVETEVNGKKVDASNGTQVRIEALQGKENLIFCDEHIVNFYYGIEPTRKVYVRHLVYNESTQRYEIDNVLTNSNAAIKDGEENKYYLRENGYNQRKCKNKNSLNFVDVVALGFNEQYTIDFSDTIKLEKSRTIENEGFKYEYKGYITENNVASEDIILTEKDYIETLEKTDVSVTLNPDNVQTTYVDFYYTKTIITPPGKEPYDENDDYPIDSPEIKFIPQDDSGNNISLESTGNNGNCKVVYVPSGENLKAYVKAITYRPYSLSYEGVSIDEVTGVIIYSLDKYEVYKFINGQIKNNSNSNYGTFNSKEKIGVFNTNSDVSINPIVTDITSEIENSIAYYQNLNPMNIAQIIDGRKTTESDFGTENIHKVEKDKYNGIRNPSGIANYDIVSLVSGGVVQDNGVNNKIGNTISINAENNDQVNVYTPAAIKELKVESQAGVNHSNQDNFVIQANSEFKVTPITDKSTEYNEVLGDTVKYIEHYWFVTEFDVKLLDNRLVYNASSGNIINVQNGQVVSAGNLIQITKGGSLSAIALNVGANGGSVSQFSNNLKVIAVTYNVTEEEFEKKILSEIKIDTKSDYVKAKRTQKILSNCEAKSTTMTHSRISDIGLSKVNTMYDDACYFVEYTKESKNIGRIYDFKVTDCLDVNFKNVFRKSDSGNVNDLRGIKYFSGVRKLLVYGGNGVQIGANQSNQNNIFVDISTFDNTINSVSTKTILPLGPYKHVDSNYLQAPKLGYRISFDLKTSGTYVKSSNSMLRYIKITPSYYYISKDGSTYKNNIALYYKNSTGKYVNFEGSGYTIYFKPNDGYRSIYNSETPELDTLSTKLEALKIGGTTSDKSFILTDSMMSHSSNNFVQSWYGEFKLPNSTIVVEVDENGRKDMNNPLTDGYLGVKFDIECIDKKSENSTDSTVISYSQNDKSNSSAVNTSQWDYEGYLGFGVLNIGNKLNSDLRIQLEKGIWKITGSNDDERQQMYEKVKGTVVLYDIDDRAANDFD